MHFPWKFKHNNDNNDDDNNNSNDNSNNNNNLFFFLLNVILSKTILNEIHIFSSFTYAYYE
ncbi:hypothetical protein PVIIG_05144 [Plasmodium vivax India VII]|uniref:Uncharacterized protein n=2 Tax=Plasmodium vivax TaxID=5855 RepID=A5KCN8_PLAVS|nr:hypothetical protein PVX_112640 [Plasmodium vivax]EDL42868.1 hypothetical protein PVX_112640 [Plasmodium vivax]KMZ76656.1 hypothetical protein PVIIG_05144 [Plasmodium vivax India VII]|eukprot:XP_001612642.1 hypothetical protein [Plasmodium vivax Sal-1]